MYCSLDGQEPKNIIVLNTRHETCLRINTRDQLIDRLVLIITVSDHAINYKQTNDANNYWLVHFFGLVLLIKNADRMLVSKNQKSIREKKLSCHQDILVGIRNT